MFGATNTTMAPFRSASEHELALLTDEQLVAHAQAARSAHDAGQATLALQLLVYRYERIARAVVRRKVPDHVVEDVLLDGFVAATAAVLDNPPEAKSERQVRGWVLRIVSNHCANWWRGRGERELDEMPLLDPADEDANGWEPGARDPGYDVVPYQDIVDRELDKLSANHRRAVELRVFDGHSSKETVELLRQELGWETTANNIDAIASRFRRDCRRHNR